MRAGLSAADEGKDCMDEKKSVFSGLFWTFGERIIAQLVSFAVTVVLARLIAPEAYGTIEIVVVFIALANATITGGLGNALIQKKDSDDRDFSSICYVNITLGVVLYLIVFFLAPHIEAFYSFESLAAVLRVMALKLPLAGLNSVQHAYVSKHLIFKKFFFATLIGTVVSAFVGIKMAYMGYGVWALVAQYLTNSAIDTVVLWLTIGWHPKRMFSWESVRNLVPYGGRILIASVVDELYQNIRSLLIGKFFGSADLAYYNKGKQFPNIVVNNINASVIKVLFPSLSKHQDDTAHFKSMLRKAMRFSAFVLFPIMVLVAALGKPIVLLLLTEKWLPCVPYIAVFCIGLMFRPVNSCNLQGVKAIGASRTYLWLEIIKKIVGLLIMMISLVFFRTPYAVAVGYTITCFMSLIINSAPNKKLLDYSLLEQLWDLLPIMICTAVMGAAVYFTIQVVPYNILKIVLGGLEGVAIYLALCKLLRIGELRDAAAFLKKAVGKIKR